MGSSSSKANKSQPQSPKTKNSTHELSTSKSIDSGVSSLGNSGGSSLGNSGGSSLGNSGVSSLGNSGRSSRKTILQKLNKVSSSQSIQSDASTLTNVFSASESGKSKDSLFSTQSRWSRFTWSGTAGSSPTGSSAQASVGQTLDHLEVFGIETSLFKGHPKWLEAERILQQNPHLLVSH